MSEYENSDCSGELIEYGTCYSSDGSYMENIDSEAECTTDGGTWQEITPRGFFVDMAVDCTASNPSYC